jgi:hypothetical protein
MLLFNDFAVLLHDAMMIALGAVAGAAWARRAAAGRGKEGGNV